KYKEDGYKLGLWVSNQRKRRAIDKVGFPERETRLDELGFIWDVQNADWDNGFSALVKFTEREGHCRVPLKHIEGDYNLGVWGAVQRQNIDKMSPERKKRLEELGFLWDPLGAD